MSRLQENSKNSREMVSILNFRFKAQSEQILLDQNAEKNLNENNKYVLEDSNLCSERNKKSKIIN